MRRVPVSRQQTTRGGATCPVMRLRQSASRRRSASARATSASAGSRPSLLVRAMPPRRMQPGHTTVQAYGPGAERNFPGETIREPPVALGEEGKQPRARATSASSGTRGALRGDGPTYQARVRSPARATSASRGTRAALHAAIHLKASGAEGSHKPDSSGVLGHMPPRRMHTTYDSAALQARGLGAKRKFPSEAIELHVTEGAKRKQHKRRTQEGHTRGACHGSSLRYGGGRPSTGTASAPLPAPASAARITTADTHNPRDDHCGPANSSASASPRTATPTGVAVKPSPSLRPPTRPPPGAPSEPGARERGAPWPTLVGGRARS
jgi:hypothetical protein